MWAGVRSPRLALHQFALHAAEARVDAVRFEEFVVRADLGDGALVEDQQTVGVTQRRQAVGDGKGSASLSGS